MTQDVHADKKPDTLEELVRGTSSGAGDRQLTTVQKEVLLYLGTKGRAATSRELECVAHCGRDELERALDDLCARNLVGSLNTVIPSFVSRCPGVRVYGE